MKYTIIITAYKEETTLPKALRYLADPQMSGYEKELELIQVSPDTETLEAGKKYIEELQNQKINFKQIQDEKNGKPAALNKSFFEVTGENVILTDGDVFLEKFALNTLISKYEELELDAACGNVVSLNERNTFMGYISHMMTKAAHHKRMIELLGIVSGIGTQIIAKTSHKENLDRKFFPLSGYLLIFNKSKLENITKTPLQLPEDCLVEDAYLSYFIFNHGLKLGYIPEAVVRAYFPTNLSDYFLQKKRSTGGYIQLWKYGVVSQDTKARSFWQDLQYFWFPFKFARNLKEYFWSLIYFPIRFYLWMIMYWERKIIKKDFTKTWVRIESTK